MWCRLEIKNKKIFKEELWDDGDFYEGLAEESFGGRQAHKEKGRKEKKSDKRKGKQSEALLAEDLGKFPIETPAVPENEDKKEQKPVAQPELAEKSPKRNEVVPKTVWYPGIVKDLREAISLKVFSQEHKEAIERLRSNGVKLPEVIWNQDALTKTGTEKDLERTKIGSALDRLLGEKARVSRWGSRKAAGQYLKDELGIEAAEIDKLLSRREKKAERVPEEGKAEMSFEEKAKMVENAGYGGTLFGTYKRYLEGGDAPFDLDHVMVQIGRLFPFDVREFARVRRGMNQKKEEEAGSESKSEDWQGKYNEDRLFLALRDSVDGELWQKKIEEWSGLDEKTRENQLTILRALIKIKGEGLLSPASMRLWESQKGRLVELGLMI